MAVSGWSSVSRRRRISSAFSNSGWACGVLPLGVEVGRQVVVAVGGVGVVVGEQAAADLQRLLEQRLGLGVLPLGVEGFRLLIHGIGRLVGDSILVRHRGHPAQRLETPLRVHRLEVLRPLDPRPQGEQFLGPRDRLVPAIGLQRRLDGLVQLLRPLGVVAGQLSQSRCRGLTRRRCGRLTWHYDAMTSTSNPSHAALSLSFMGGLRRRAKWFECQRDPSAPRFFPSVGSQSVRPERGRHRDSSGSWP